MQSEESGAFLSPVWLPTFTLRFNLAQFAFKSCTSNNFIYLLASRRFTAVSYNSEGGDKKYVLKKKGIGKHCFHLALMVQGNFML